MNFDIFKGTLTYLLTMPINISFTISVIYFARARYSTMYSLEFELNFALGHEQFKLILKFPVSCTWLQNVPENFHAVHVIILMQLQVKATLSSGK